MEKHDKHILYKAKCHQLQTILSDQTRAKQLNLNLIYAQHKVNLSTDQQLQNYIQLYTADLETTVRLSNHDLFLESGKIFGNGELNNPVSVGFHKIYVLK